MADDVIAKRLLASAVVVAGVVAGVGSIGGVSAAPTPRSSASVATTWVVEHVPAGVTGVGAPACPTALHCWALASGRSGVEGILATADGGATWSLQSAPHASDLDAIGCTPGTEACWAVGTTGSLGGAVIDAFSVAQYGPAWSAQTVPAGVGALQGVACPSPTDCVAVGAVSGGGSADAVVTGNGGLSWTAYPTAPSEAFTGVSCPSTSHCTALAAGGGVSGEIYGSSDGGQLWALQYERTNLSSRRFTGVSCPSTSVCYAVGQSQSAHGFGSVVEVTTDGGSKWTSETPPAGASTIGLDGVSCPSVSTCWTSDGSFFSTTVSSFFDTTDGGTSWAAAGAGIASGDFSGPACSDVSTCLAGGTTVGNTPRGLFANTRNAQGLGCGGTLPAGQAAGLAPEPDGTGYWLASTGGGVVACGRAPFYGSLAAEHKAPSAPIVAVAAATGGNGYYLLADDGTVYGFGPGAFVRGSGPRAGAPYVGMAVDGGYWLVSATGGVFSFGAPYLGSVPGLGIRIHDIVGIAADDAAEGYWLVAADGGVFSFRAPYRGSVPGVGVHVRNVVAMIAAPAETQDYYLVGADGGVYTFGSGLTFCGSAAGRTSAPVVAGALYPGSGGYWLTGRDGALYGFDAPDDGSAWSPAGLHTVC